MKNRTDTQRLAEKDNAKSIHKWLLYGVVGILPTIVALLVLAHNLVHCHPSPHRMFECITIPQQPTSLIQKAIPFFLLLLFMELLINLVLKKGYYRLNDSINSLYMGTMSTLISTFSKALAVFPYAFVRERFKIIELDDDQEIGWTHPMWWVMFFTVEFAYYWLHRFAHEWNAFWAGHIVHHQSDEYNLSTALRQGIGQQMFSWIFYLFAAPFCPIPLFVFHSEWNTIYQFWIHTRLIKKFPAPVEFFFNTPSHHRVHHGRNPQYIDKNYGGTLIIFDRMFGTFEPEVEEPVYGITHAISTWNPLYLQTQHWGEIVAACKETEGLFQKIRVFLDRGPFYTYQILTPLEEQKAPLPPQKHIKYDSTMPNPIMTIYGFVQAGALIATAVAFLEFANNLSLTARIVIMAYIFFGLFTTSALFDRRSYGRTLESLRLLAAFGLACWVDNPTDPLSFLADLRSVSRTITAAAVAVVFSLVTLFVNYRLPKEQIKGNKKHQ